MSARYLCDCGAGYSHPDQLLYCAQNNHGTAKVDEALEAELARAREAHAYLAGLHKVQTATIERLTKERDELYNERHLFVIDKERQRLAAELAKAREEAGRYGDEVFDAVAIRVRALEAELAEAREALKQIAGYVTVVGNKSHKAEALKEIARAALAAKHGETS